MKTRIGTGLSLPPLTALLYFVCLVAATSAQAASWVLEFADTADQVSEEQIDELETQARNGDWQLKEEFAAAYLYETSYPQIYGCARLKFGHRCRAMSKRVSSARVFLREIIDTTPRDRTETIDIGSFQEDYAGSLRLSLSSDPNSDVCQEAIHYYELAVANGGICTALHLENLAKRGICMTKNQERAEAYRNMISPMTGCPTP